MTTSLISVQDADVFLAAFGEVFPEETIPLTEATGRILRQPVRADREYPAQDRSRMDGIAISFAAWEMGVRDFRVEGMARAGEPRRRLDDAAACVEIMTGAPCPEGADTVIPYEALKTREFGETGVASVASDADATVAQGQFLHRQGSDCAAAAHRNRHDGRRVDRDRGNPAAAPGAGLERARAARPVRRHGGGGSTRRR
ncbi:MAG: moeA [Fibrobacteria bacterium]|nr:moeA [Fibrobacteria bacterium]